MKVIIASALILVLCTVVNALTSTEIAQIVNAHNAERALVGLGPVTYNTSIEQTAQTYINGCPAGHSGNNALGENLYWGSNLDLTAAVNLWAGEKQYWNCATNQCCKGSSCDWSYCGHYTQVVWYSSNQIGCGYKLCNGMYMVICNYYRPGNFNCNPFCNPQVVKCPGTTTPVARATPVATPVAAPKASSTPVAAPRATPIAAPKATPVAATPRATPVATPKSAPVTPVATPRAAPVAVTPTGSGSTPQSSAPVDSTVPQSTSTPVKTNSPQAATSLTSGSQKLVCGVVTVAFSLLAL